MDPQASASLLALLPDVLLPYFARTAVAVVLGAVLLWLLPRGEALGRILVYVMLFILARDAMTPLGMWEIGGTGPVWIRFAPDPVLLTVLGLVCAAAVLLINSVEPSLRQLLVWRKGPAWQVVAVGLLTPVLLFLPILWWYRSFPVGLRGGAVASEVLPAIVFMSMLGNLLEETLFRGYFQGWCEQNLPAWKAAVLAGVLFAFGHVYLAFTVTTVGLPIVAFTLYEGLACALLRMRWGLIPAALTHGGLILLIASGLA